MGGGGWVGGGAVWGWCRGRVDVLEGVAVVSFGGSRSQS